MKNVFYVHWFCKTMPLPGVGCRRKCHVYASGGWFTWILWINGNETEILLFVRYRNKWQLYVPIGYIVSCTLMRTFSHFLVLGGDVQITSGTFSNSAQTQRFIGGLGIHHIGLNQTVGEAKGLFARFQINSPNLCIRVVPWLSILASPHFCGSQGLMLCTHLDKMYSYLFSGCHYLCWMVFVRFCLSTWAHMRAKQALKPWKQQDRFSCDFGSIAKFLSTEKQNAKTNGQVRGLHGLQTWGQATWRMIDFPAVFHNSHQWVVFSVALYAEVCCFAWNLCSELFGNGAFRDLRKHMRSPIGQFIFCSLQRRNPWGNGLVAHGHRQMPAASSDWSFAGKLGWFHAECPGAGPLGWSSLNLFLWYR